VDVLFSNRGAILVFPALLAVLSSSLSLESLASGLPLLLVGLFQRAWATAHIGGEGRTRSPEAPLSLVSTGPYALMDHPLYVANLALAFGLVLALRPPAPIGFLLVGFLVVFYAVLARREDDLLANREQSPRKTPPSWLAVPRHERSTWLGTAALLVLAAF